MKTLYERISPYLTKTGHEALGERLFICDAALKAADDRKISSAEVGWLRETASSPSMMASSPRRLPSYAGAWTMASGA